MKIVYGMTKDYIGRHEPGSIVRVEIEGTDIGIYSLKNKDMKKFPIPTTWVSLYPPTTPGHIILGMIKQKKKTITVYVDRELLVMRFLWGVEHGWPSSVLLQVVDEAILFSVKYGYLKDKASYERYRKVRELAVRGGYEGERNVASGMAFKIAERILTI